MINTIWLFLIVFGIIIATATGKVSHISTLIFESAGRAVEFTIGLAGIIAFWSGILKIAEASGLTEIVAKFFEPLLQRLFPSLRGQKRVMGLISLTVTANLFGLGNMVTPLGLKAMGELQSLNPDKERASNDMCTFLALIFGGMNLIPTTLMAVRSQAGSKNPSLILGPTFLVTVAGTITCLIINFLALKISPAQMARRKE